MKFKAMVLSVLTAAFVMTGGTALAAPHQSKDARNHGKSQSSHKDSPAHPHQDKHKHGDKHSILGDINGNGKVDNKDLSLLLAKFGTSDQKADLNSDGIVNTLDMSILLNLLAA